MFQMRGCFVFFFGSVQKKRSCDAMLAWWQRRTRRSVSSPTSTVLLELAFITIGRSTSPEAWYTSQWLLFFFFFSSLSMKIKRCLLCLLATSCSFFMVTGMSVVLCHSCASIALWPSLVRHVLRVCTGIAIEHNYGVSVLILHMFSVQMEDPRDHGMRWMNAPPYTTYRLPSSGTSAGTPYPIRRHMASARAGLCASRSNIYESNRDGGKLHSSCFNADSSSPDVWATVIILWKRSCGSTWTSSPSILTEYFGPRVITAWTI